MRGVSIPTQVVQKEETIEPKFNLELLRIADEDLISEVEQNEKVFKNMPNKAHVRPDLNNWEEVLERLKIDPDQTYKEPPICIEIEDKEGTCRFGTLGNFSVVIGKAKSRKTFLISLLLGAALKKQIL